MYCKKCGQPVDPAAKFCGKCGLPIVVEPPAPPPPTPQPTTTGPDPVPPQPPPPPPPLPPQTDVRPEKPLSEYISTLFVPGLWQIQNNDTTKGFVMLGLALLLLCATCIGYFGIGLWSMIDAQSVDCGRSKRW